jgi:hypothetical protein
MIYDDFPDKKLKHHRKTRSEVSSHSENRAGSQVDIYIVPVYISEKDLQNKTAHTRKIDAIVNRLTTSRIGSR